MFGFWTPACKDPSRPSAKNTSSFSPLELTCSPEQLGYRVIPAGVKAKLVEVWNPKDGILNSTLASLFKKAKTAPALKRPAAAASKAKAQQVKKRIMNDS